jgi:DNA-binding response OmpR family regulator
MAAGNILMIDADAQRGELACEWLRGQQFEAALSTTAFAVAAIQKTKPDLVLLRIDAGAVESFHSLSRVLSDVFIVPFIERGFSQKLRDEVMALQAVGFLNDELPRDELLASIHAFIRQKRAIEQLKQAIGYRDSRDEAEANPSFGQSGNPGSLADIANTIDTAAPLPLRERSPHIYKTVLARYEEAIKQVLHHKIYKINDEAFEPFRHIAKDLFHANATARDAVELHYNTLRKIAPTPDSPRAQAYLEVGRTTIIGLMGDLLMFYRDSRRELVNTNNYSGAPSEPWAQPRQPK